MTPAWQHPCTVLVTFGWVLGPSSYEEGAATWPAAPHSQTQSFCSAAGTLTAVGTHAGTEPPRSDSAEVQIT